MSEADFWRMATIVAIVGFLVEYALTAAIVRLMKSQNDLAKKQAALIEELVKDD